MDIPEIGRALEEEFGFHPEFEQPATPRAVTPELLPAPLFVPEASAGPEPEFEPVP